MLVCLRGRLAPRGEVFVLRERLFFIADTVSFWGYVGVRLVRHRFGARRFGG